MSKWWLHNYRGAIADYDKAIVLDPTCGGYYCNRGQARFSLKMVPEALADYDRAIELDPRNAQAYYNRGTLMAVSLTNYARAVADLTKALDLHSDPYEKDIFFWRGKARLELKEYAGAVADFSKALESNQDSDWSYRSSASTNRDIALRLLRESKKK